MIKLVIVIRRNPAMTFDEFKAHFANVHGKLATECPACQKYVRKYVQSYRQEAEHDAHQGAAARFDGLTELWFDSHEDMC